MFDVISIGGATRDMFFEVEGINIGKAKSKLPDSTLKIPYGEKLVAKESYYAYGGGAINIAICLKKLGLNTAPFCNIGKEGTGSLIVAELKNEKINTALIKRDSIHHTGLSIFILGNDGDHTGILERGANNYLTIEKKSALKKTKWFYISSLTGKSAEILPEIFELAERKDIRIAFNPGSEQLKMGYPYLKNFLRQAEVLLLNLEEAEELIASKLKRQPKDEKEIAQELSKIGPTITVVTKGSGGSFALFEGNQFTQKAYGETVADTTGAGDSFSGTFLFGIIKGFDLRYCLKIAAINSASVVSKMGAHPGLLNYNGIRSSKWL